MPSPLVQSWFSTVSTSPRAATAGASVTANNLVVLVVRFSNAPTGTTITLDGVAPTEVLPSAGQNESGGSVVEHVYYFENIAGGSGAVSVAWTGGGSAKWKAHEYTGLATSSSLTQSGRGSGAAATSGTSPSVTTTVANSLVLGCFTTSGVPTYTAGTQGPSGYTLDDANSLAGIQIEEQVLSSTASLTADMAFSASVNWASYILVFKYAAGAVATSIASNSGDAQSAIAGAAVATPPSVIVKDASNNPVSGVSVTFAVASGGGSVSGASQVTDGSGIATVGSWTLGTVAGSNSLTASSGTLTGSPVTFTATGIAGAAASIAANAGDHQTAPPNTNVAVAPSVIVKDANGNVVSGVSVTFAVGSGGGSVTGAAATTDTGGVATVGSWTLGGTAGSNTLTATSAGLTGSPVTFTATAVAGVGWGRWTWWGRPLGWSRWSQAGGGSTQITVSSVSPATVSSLGGATVTITGTGFLGSNTVKIDGTLAPNVVVTSTTITCTVPAHAIGVVDIVVTQPGSTDVTLSGQLTYSDTVMTISGVSPSTVGSGGGMQITITGTNFQSSSTVLVGGTAATSVVTVNATTITCLVPAEAAGSYSVTVQHAGVGDGVLVNGLTYAVAPAPIYNVQYDGASGAHQQCDIINGAAPNSPIVIVLHAGGWAQTRANQKAAQTFWKQLGDTGVCAVIGDYYITSDSGYNRTKGVLNVRQIVLFFRDPANAALHNGDPTNIIVVGHSAGGHLALLAAIDGTARGDGSCPDRLGLWSPPGTMSRIYNSAAKAAVKAFFGGLDLTGNEALYAQYSPSSPTCIAVSLGTPATFPICPTRLVGARKENTLTQQGIDAGNYDDLVAQAAAHGQTIITRYWTAPQIHHNYTGEFTQGSNLACDDSGEMIAWITSGGTVYNIGSVDRDSVGSNGLTTITLTAGAGQSFSAGSTVTIGGASATSVVVVDSQTITCRTPAKPGGLTARNIDGGPWAPVWADIVVSTSGGTPYWTLTKRLTYWGSPNNVWMSTDIDSHPALTAVSTPLNVGNVIKQSIVTAADHGIAAHSGTKVVYTAQSATSTDDVHLSMNPAKSGVSDYVGPLASTPGRFHRHYFQIPAASLAATALTSHAQIKLDFTRTSAGTKKGFIMIGEGQDWGSDDNRFHVASDELGLAIIDGPPITPAVWHEFQVAIYRDNVNTVGGPFGSSHIGYAVTWYDGNVLAITGLSASQLQGFVPAAGDPSPPVSLAGLLGQDETGDRGAVFGIYVQAAIFPIEHYTDDVAVADGFIDPP